MIPQSFWQFLPLGILLVMLPGADFLLVAVLALSRGVRFAVVAVSGIVCGILLHAALAGFGLSLLLMRHPPLIELIKWLGAFYLCVLAWQYFQARGVDADQTRDGLSVKRLRDRAFVTGFLTNLFNPKVILTSSLVYLQFADVDAVLWQQFLFLGAVMAVIAAAFFSSLAVFVAMVRRAVPLSRRGQVWSSRLAGVVFLLLAVGLVADWR